MTDLPSLRSRVTAGTTLLLLLVFAMTLLGVSAMNSLDEAVQEELDVLRERTMLVQDLRHPIPASQAIKVEICGLYWHFVDIVWIVIFTFVYLIPTFERFASHG